MSFRRKRYKPSLEHKSSLFLSLSLSYARFMINITRLKKQQSSRLWNLSQCLWDSHLFIRRNRTARSNHHVLYPPPLIINHPSLLSPAHHLLPLTHHTKSSLHLLSVYRKKKKIEKKKKEEERSVDRRNRPKEVKMGSLKEKRNPSYYP